MDFSKKRYKLIPGENYEDGPISKYGTFGNMVRTKVKERNQQLADSLPGIGEKPSEEFLTGVTDSVNPGGVIGSVAVSYTHLTLPTIYSV